MNLQFFHAEDLYRFMKIILEKKPQNHIFHVGNDEVVRINKWARLCYETAGKEHIFKDKENRVHLMKVYRECLHTFKWIDIFF